MRTLTINSAALAHNLERVRAYAPDKKVLAMIKANAYGHDLLTVATALRSAEGFGVADLSEAICLRKAGFKQTILVMRGFHDLTELQAFAHYGLTAVVHNEVQLAVLEQNSLSGQIGVWLKVDSGMHRLGLPPAKVAAVFARLRACANVLQPLCVMTHFADANDSSQLATARQLSVFSQCLATVPKTHTFETSLANSAGIIRYPASQGDWVRPGIMLYGASPFNDHAASDYGLQAVMTLKTRLIAIHALAKGDAIGYGGSYVCPKSMTIGVIAFGYGDGYPRLAPTGTPVLINGQLVPIVGRVSMDLITVDLSALSAVALGAEATLWGEGLPIETIAHCVETISYELFCHIQRHRINTR